MKQLLVVVVVVGSACKHSPARDPEIVEFHADTAARLEVAGVVGDKGTVDVPLPKVPKPGEQVFLVWPTVCGNKRVAIALPPPRGGKLGKAGGSERDVIDYRYDFDLPPGVDKEPATTSIVFDRALTATVGIGALTGKVTAGKPDQALVPPKEQPSQSVGVKAVDFACVDAITVDGAKLPLPPLPAKGAPTLFVTNRPDQCFVERFIAYGAPGETAFDGKDDAVKLTGARLYWLRAATPYDFWFAPAGDTTTSSDKLAVRAQFDECH